LPAADTVQLDKALQLHRQGKLEAAEKIYRHILADQPDHRDALNNLGILLRMQDRTEDAIAVLHHLTNIAPEFAEAWNSYGRALTSAGRLEDARAALQRALSINPELVVAHLNIAFTFELSGDLEQAAASIHRYLAAHPDNPEALERLGCYLHDLGHDEDALKALRQSVELAPDRHSALIALAFALEKSEQYEDAIANRKRALIIAPDDVECLGDMAISLERLGQIDEAITARKRTIALAPQDAASMGDLGRLLTENDEDGEAAGWFERALNLAPDAPRIHFNHALYLLRRGEYEQGWAEHEWRQEFASLKDIFPDYPQPRWDGSSLAGKTIFLHGEQGAGDTIQFSRFVPEVARQAAKVILGVREPLARLLAPLPGVDQIITDPLDLPDFDVRCSLLSLPHHLRVDPDSDPSKVPYLANTGSFPVQISDGKLNVGLVWGGSPTHKNDHNRSLTLSQLKPFLDITGCRFHNLQVDDRKLEISADGLSDHVLDMTDNIRDLADTADLIAQLDLVIAVDTSVAHLAGAMGTPVWILLPKPADWRWLRDREDSPWYPTARLFRQTKRGDWEDVIERVASELEAYSLRQAGRLN
jgi:tetratricopeptide (TPR) repeat protein